MEKLPLTTEQENQQERLETGLPLLPLHVHGQNSRCTPYSILSRVAILFVGVSLGFITITPNAMLSDNGSELAGNAAIVGLSASFAMAVGGVVGCMQNRWRALLPGICAEIVLIVFLMAYGAIDQLLHT